MEMRPQTEGAFRLILDTFSGDDGGRSFVAIKQFVEVTDQQAGKGDRDAAELITIMKRFAKMIEIAKRGYYGA